jgi:hypothetical protein
MYPFYDEKLIVTTDRSGGQVNCKAEADADRSMFSVGVRPKNSVASSRKMDPDTLGAPDFADFRARRRSRFSTFDWTKLSIC